MLLSFLQSYFHRLLQRNLKGFPSGLVTKNLPASAGEIGFDPGLGKMPHAMEQLSLCLRAKSLQSCPTLCDSVGCNSPGSAVHGILQARILEWVAMPSSSGSSLFLRLLHWQVGSLPLAPPGKPSLYSHIDTMIGVRNLTCLSYLSTNSIQSCLTIKLQRPGATSM